MLVLMVFTDIVKLLLKDPRVNAGDLDNYAIIQAVTYAHEDIVDLLLVDPNCNPGARSNKALRIACRLGYIDIARKLLAHPKINRENNLTIHQGSLNNCMIIATRNENISILEILILDDRVNIDEVIQYCLDFKLLHIGSLILRTKIELKSKIQLEIQSIKQVLSNQSC